MTTALHLEPKISKVFGVSISTAQIFPQVTICVKGNLTAGLKHFPQSRSGAVVMQCQEEYREAELLSLMGVPLIPLLP